MALKYAFPQMLLNSSTYCSLYGVVNLPAAMKKSVKITGWMQGAGGDYKNTIQVQMNMKYTGSSEEALAYKYMTQNTGQVTFEKTVNLANATQIGFHFDGLAQSRVTFRANIYLELTTDIASEEKITASKLNELIEVVGVGSSVLVGETIKIANYNALATEVGASSFDSTNPLSSDITALVSAINSAEIDRAWSGTSQSDYNGV